MTPEQAVNWLILEGWVVCYDTGSADVWWVRRGENRRGVNRPSHSGTTKPSKSVWRTEEFQHVACPSKYPQYAVEVVDLILKGEVE